LRRRRALLSIAAAAGMLIRAGVHADAAKEIQAAQESIAKAAEVCNLDAIMNKYLDWQKANSPIRNLLLTYP
jgi:hypothetical protein